MLHGLARPQICRLGQFPENNRMPASGQENKVWTVREMRNANVLSNAK